MPVFTIETTYRLPVCRHQTYEAATTEEACRLAVDDDDWSDEKRDYESAGEPYVTGIWSGENAAYSGAAQPIPSHYVETPSALDEFRGCDLVCFCAPGRATAICCCGSPMRRAMSGSLGGASRWRHERTTTALSGSARERGKREWEKGQKNPLPHARPARQG